MDALPKGETTPVRVEIRGYRLDQEEGRAVLGFESLTASREWIGALAAALLPEKRFRLPKDAPYELLKQYI